MTSTEPKYAKVTLEVDGVEVYCMGTVENFEKESERWNKGMLAELKAKVERSHV